MDETEFSEHQYASFLVRLWHCAESAPEDSNGQWQGEIEHIQSGRRWAFGSAQELWHFLGQQMADSIQFAKDGPATP